MKFSDIRKDFLEGLEPEELQNLKDGFKARVGDEIDMNDFAVGKIIAGKKGTPASLVKESDGSVRWYVNPNDRDDTILRTVFVKKVRER